MLRQAARLPPPPPARSASHSPTAPAAAAPRRPYRSVSRAARITSAPPATPAVTAIHPASRPITSTTCTRLCASVVECSRSTASVAIVTAVSKPKQASVPLKSLSIVFGTPTQVHSPGFISSTEIDCVSSPPSAISCIQLHVRRITFQTAFEAALNLLHVRPRRTQNRPSTSAESRWSSANRAPSSGPRSRPRHPSMNPTNSSPYCSTPLRTTARINRIEPGAIPAPSQHSNSHKSSPDQTLKSYSH